MERTAYHSLARNQLVVRSLSRAMKGSSRAMEFGRVALVLAELGIGA